MPHAIMQAALYFPIGRRCRRLVYELVNMGGGFLDLLMFLGVSHTDLWDIP